MELLKNSKDKRARKLAKKRVSIFCPILSPLSHTRWSRIPDDAGWR